MFSIQDQRFKLYKFYFSASKLIPVRETQVTPFIFIITKFQHFSKKKHNFLNIIKERMRVLVYPSKCETSWYYFSKNDKLYANLQKLVKENYIG